MNDRDIFDKLTRILRDLLADDAIVLGRETTREDVPSWDSFNYVTFMAAVEVEYGIRFQISDVESFQTVGEIADRIKALKS